MCIIETMLVLMQGQEGDNPAAHGSRLSTGRELGESTGYGLPKGTLPWFAAGPKRL